jgi:hypothetical protein
MKPNSSKMMNTASVVATNWRGVRRLSKASGTQSLDKNRLQFSLRLCVSAVMIGLLLGCSVTRGTRKPDGTLRVTNYRALWGSEAVSFTLGSSNLTVTLAIGKSASDDKSVGAVTEGAVKGALGRP